MNLLDGKKLSSEIKEELKNELANYSRKVGLAVVLVGNDKASELYVSMKKKACEYVGINSISVELPEDISQEELENRVLELNIDSKVDGILVQLPLPKHLNTDKILELIDPKKDVDGFHPTNVGGVLTGLDTFAPCTPLGMVELLDKYEIDIQGKNVVVVGASNIVGKPIASLLLNRNATVEICHIYTQNLKEHTLKADILVVAVGKENLIGADMVKDGVVVLDVGINKRADGKIVGDVDFENVSKKASYITPVPGGVGPMTIAMLLKNTVKSAKIRDGK
ncbi:5,10-methylene-tetrahydrofolate dehydrogenase/methenyl tetrahydrofolate cyclohydrolase [Thiovulum sp. ES]|nr:5,10-methylene-tetrahydrofolate dehydrogenase/methenyl tetrahydrofolate cyclohydrolase [Thiovulum sp. ES]